MTTELLKSAYFHHRARAVGRVYPKPRGQNMNPALEAIAAARDDVSAYQAAMGTNDTARAARVRRYSSSPWRKPYGAVTWQPGKPGLAFVEHPGAAGLRFVGRAAAYDPRMSSTWDSSGRTGWFTNVEGEHSRDGSGLCWGEVYQLPGRDGCARFVAGYRIGDSDGLMVDLGTVYSSADAYQFEIVCDNDDAREAAHAADEHARVAADHEREFQTAWQAGSQWAALGEEITQLRRGALEDLATRRALRGDATDSPAWTRACTMVRERVADALEEIARLRARRDKLAGGNADPLIFYPSDELRAAFADGAGIYSASQL